MKEAKHATASAGRTQLSRKKTPRPRKGANSAQRSTSESTSAPRGWGRARAARATRSPRPPGSQPPLSPAGRPVAPLALDLPAQEGLDPLLGEIVGQLARRVLHQVRGHAQERTTDLPIARHPAA